MSPVQTVTHVSGSDLWKLARLEEEISSELFEVLEDWEHQLKAQNIDFEELGL